MRFQLAENTDLLRAVTASGGDLLEYYLREEDKPGQEDGDGQGCN
jgi:hypothetical protein